MIFLFHVEYERFVESSVVTLVHLLVFWRIPWSFDLFRQALLGFTKMTSHTGIA